MLQMGGGGSALASVPLHIPGVYAVAGAGAQLGGGGGGGLSAQLPVGFQAPLEFNLAGRVKGPGRKPSAPHPL